MTSQSNVTLSAVPKGKRFQATLTYFDGVSISSAESYSTVAEAILAAAEKLLAMPERLVPPKNAPDEVGETEDAGGAHITCRALSLIRASFGVDLMTEPERGKALFAGMSRQRLKKTPGFGPVTIEEIERWLDFHGEALRDG